MNVKLRMYRYCYSKIGAIFAKAEVYGIYNTPLESAIQSVATSKYSGARFSKLFRPVKPFSVHLYLKTARCIHLKLLV